MKVLVTGGAGFIGSHLVDRLMETGNQVRVIDNLASGQLSNLDRWMDHQGFEFIEGDLLERDASLEAVEGCSQVFHLAANPEVQANKADPEEHFRQNIEATYSLLEAVAERGGVELLVFASTSTVYGEATVLPTPEGYGPTKPISMYGASKLACEALISAYASMHGFKAVIYRLANVVGPRSNHGVIWDFVGKLRGSPEELEVLGDGTQSKSYLYIDDCVDGFLKGVESVEQVAVFNIGSMDRASVLRIAEIVKEEAGQPEAMIRLTGGVDGGRGWKGDVKLMHLDTASLRRLGWAPKYNSEEAVRLTARAVSEQ
ncbi:NAD-dependent epimerase/dehydratase family protein, partial [Candidatus Bathyarchaeota archaeon]|nr:NAD-dependent epimerase/dehydratase family protein [Candidatus Bathyarchaeota archaeon]